MAGRCSICVHPERDVIETDLVSGATTRDIAGRFGVSRSAVFRHCGSQATGRHNVALAGIKELRGILEFAAKMSTVAPEPVTIQLSSEDGTPVDRPLRVIEAKPQPGEQRTLHPPD